MRPTSTGTPTRTSRAVKRRVAEDKRARPLAYILSLALYPPEYILSTMKAARAKLFQNGGSQAVRLPRECRFEGQLEVVVKRIGRRVILEPVDEWPDEFLKSLGSLPGDIPRPKRVPITRLRDPFE